MNDHSLKIAHLRQLEVGKPHQIAFALKRNFRFNESPARCIVCYKYAAYRIDHGIKKHGSQPVCSLHVTNRIYQGSGRPIN